MTGLFGALYEYDEEQQIWSRNSFFSTQCEPPLITKRLFFFRDEILKIDLRKVSNAQIAKMLFIFTAFRLFRCQSIRIPVQILTNDLTDPAFCERGVDRPGNERKMVNMKAHLRNPFIRLFLRYIF